MTDSTTDTQQNTTVATTKEKPKHYLPANVFFAEIVKCLQAGEASHRLGEMFMLISEKYACHQDFSRYYHLREDFIAVGALACSKGWMKFKPLNFALGEWDGSDIEYNYKTCNNPFNFFTTVIRHAFLQFLKKEYGYSNVQNKMRSRMGMETTYGYDDMIAAKEAEERVDHDDESEVDSELIYMGLWDSYAPEDSLIHNVSEEETQTENE